MILVLFSCLASPFFSQSVHKNWFQTFWFWSQMPILNPCCDKQPATSCTVQDVVKLPFLRTEKHDFFANSSWCEQTRVLNKKCESLCGFGRCMLRLPQNSNSPAPTSALWNSCSHKCMLPFCHHRPGNTDNNSSNAGIQKYQRKCGRHSFPGPRGLFLRSGPVALNSKTAKMRTTGKMRTAKDTNNGSDRIQPKVSMTTAARTAATDSSDNNRCKREHRSLQSSNNDGKQQRGERNGHKFQKGTQTWRENHWVIAEALSSQHQNWGLKQLQQQEFGQNQQTKPNDNQVSVIAKIWANILLLSKKEKKKKELSGETPFKVLVSIKEKIIIKSQWGTPCKCFGVIKIKIKNSH